MNEQRPKAHVCFVCDIIFDSVEEFRSHIVQDHEEGTDFILCPHPDCQIPVRDLRVHCALKHPEFKIPEGYPVRPIIIRDARIKKFKKKVTHGSKDIFFPKKTTNNYFLDLD